MFLPRPVTIRRALKGMRSIFSPRFKILVYHSVSPTSQDPYEVTTTSFQQQMRLLSETGFQVVSLEEAFAKMTKNRIHNKMVVITFDDGFKTLERFAFPILRQFNFPAMVFLPFKYIGGIDAFSYQDPRPNRVLLDWDGIEKSQRNCISYGSHTMTHRNLVMLDDDSLRFEVEESSKILRNRIGTEFYAFAYPFGMFSKRVKKIVCDTGYDCALCFGNILSNTMFTDHFEMKREKILSSTSLKDFARLVNVKNDLSRKMMDMIKRGADSQELSIKDDLRTQI